MLTRGRKITRRDIIVIIIGGISIVFVRLRSSSSSGPTKIRILRGRTSYRLEIGRALFLRPRVLRAITPMMLHLYRRRRRRIVRVRRTAAGTSERTHRVGQVGINRVNVTSSHVRCAPRLHRPPRASRRCTGSHRRCS